MKPHRMRYWMNNERDKEPEVFDAEVRRVCEHYAKALALHQQQEGIHLVSTDEKTGTSRPSNASIRPFRCEQARSSARSTNTSATAPAL